MDENILVLRQTDQFQNQKWIFSKVLNTFFDPLFLWNKKLFFQNFIMFAIFKIIVHIKQILENMIIIIIRSCNQWVF